MFRFKGFTFAVWLPIEEITKYLLELEKESEGLMRGLMDL